jgi:hypothetical protein
MRLLSRTFFVVGISSVLFGLGSCVRYYQVNPLPEAYQPGWDADAQADAPIAFERMFYITAGGVLALALGFYLRGKARKTQFLITMCAALALTGCVLPHTVQRSPEFRGCVLDDGTKQPLAHARVALREHSSISTETDGRGSFRLSTKRSVQVTLAGPCPADLLHAEPYPWELVVSHRGYESRVIDVLKHRNLDDASNSYVAVDDIYLKANTP